MLFRSALPLGMVLGLTDHIVPAMGEEGFWIGILTALSVSATLMLIRLRYVIKKRDLPPASAPLAN